MPCIRLGGREIGKGKIGRNSKQTKSKMISQAFMKPIKHLNGLLVRSLDFVSVDQRSIH